MDSLEPGEHMPDHRDSRPPLKNGYRGSPRGGGGGYRGRGRGGFRGSSAPSSSSYSRGGGGRGGGRDFGSRDFGSRDFGSRDYGAPSRGRSSFRGARGRDMDRERPDRDMMSSRRGSDRFGGPPRRGPSPTRDRGFNGAPYRDHDSRDGGGRDYGSSGRSRDYRPSMRDVTPPRDLGPSRSADYGRYSTFDGGRMDSWDAPPPRFERRSYGGGAPVSDYPPRPVMSRDYPPKDYSSPRDSYPPSRDYPPNSRDYGGGDSGRDYADRRDSRYDGGRDYDAPPPRASYADNGRYDSYSSPRDYDGARSSRPASGRLGPRDDYRERPLRRSLSGDDGGPPMKRFRDSGPPRDGPPMRGPRGGRGSGPPRGMRR
ncbi:hypothetical protein CAPTEDRAFT_221243 [Capitella teleta]|uniref:RBM1CTR domain-containing protein n=1 Tax=Capitella teleta TaxID=283909 RepID=R7UFF7_CAPTE|nr:hypothetical protein CAPTEDRAFT_221243 [Capitella teleta]|eukprot:ELU01992.1 hypothetical protein CAPTEDRAFT_221243 [Capitella teleta]